MLSATAYATHTTAAIKPITDNPNTPAINTSADLCVGFYDMHHRVILPTAYNVLIVATIIIMPIAVFIIIRSFIY